LKQEDCIFCKIIEKSIPSNIVFEDETVIAFLDIQPINNGHVLIVPKRHTALISDVDEHVAARMFNVAQMINSSIRKSNIKAEGINFWLADGEAAFQDVFHAHLHCIPRFKNDGFKLQLPEHYRNLPTHDDLGKVADEIRTFIPKALK
jgi:histidine triad (HIT) family protein